MQIQIYIQFVEPGSTLQEQSIEKSAFKLNNFLITEFVNNSSFLSSASILNKYLYLKAYPESFFKALKI